MKAPEILDRAAQHMRDRAQARDQPDGERSMLRAVTAFNALTGHTLSERDGWLFMVALEAARACTTPTGLPDDYEDGAAYFGLAGESAQNYEVIEVAHKGAIGVDVGRPVRLGPHIYMVPDGYNFVAMDQNGEVHAYVGKPYLSETNAGQWWDTDGLGFVRLTGLPDHPQHSQVAVDWRASLMELRR